VLRTIPEKLQNQNLTIALFGCIIAQEITARYNQLFCGGCVKSIKEIEASVCLTQTRELHSDARQLEDALSWKKASLAALLIAGGVVFAAVVALFAGVKPFVIFVILGSLVALSPIWLIIVDMLPYGHIPQTMAIPLTVKLKELCDRHDKRVAAFIEMLHLQTAIAGGEFQMPKELEGKLVELSAQHEKLIKFLKTYDSLRNVSSAPLQKYREAFDDTSNSDEFALSNGENLAEVFRSLLSEIEAEQAMYGLLPSAQQKSTLSLEEHRKKRG
jgi:hypothetical protein